MTGGRWPTPEQTLLLRAALGAGQDAIDAWSAWKRAVDFECDDLDAGSYGLLPAVYRNLARVGVRDPLLGRLKGVYRYTWYQNQLCFRDVAPVLRALRDRRIDLILLEGAALTLRYHEDRGVRPIDEVDVLVRPHDVPGAVDVLAAIGWRTFAPLDERQLTSVHAKSLRHPSAPPIRLHGQALAETRLGDDEFWDESQSTRLGDLDVRVLGSTHELLRTCVHGVASDRPPSIRWIADAMVILRKAGAGIDWRRLLSAADRHHVVAPFQTAVTYLYESFGAPIPAEVIERSSPQAVPTNEPQPVARASTA